MYIETLSSSYDRPVPEILSTYPHYLEATQQATSQTSPTIDILSVPIDAAQSLVRDVHDAAFMHQNADVLQALGRHSETVIMSEMLDIALRGMAKAYIYYANGHSGVMVATAPKPNTKELYIVAADNKVLGAEDTIHREDADITRMLTNPLDRAPVSGSLLGSLSLAEVLRQVDTQGQTEAAINPAHLLIARPRLEWAIYANDSHLPWLQNEARTGPASILPVSIYEASTGRAALEAESEYLRAILDGDTEMAALVLEVYGEIWPGIDAASRRAGLQSAWDAVPQLHPGHQPIHPATPAAPDTKLTISNQLDPA